MKLHNHRATRIGTACAALAIALSLLPFATGTALAATCTKGHCGGLNPEGTGCSSGAATWGPYPDAGMVNTANGDLWGYTTLRSSSTCGTVWAKSYNTSSQTMKIYSYIRDYNTWTLYYGQTETVAAGGYSYMNRMVSIQVGHAYFAEAIVCVTTVVCSSNSGPTANKISTWGTSLTARF
jgi:hypothetical protein